MGSKKNKKIHGRPKKIPRVRDNSGRKRISINVASLKTKRRRAFELIKQEEISVEILKIALELAEKRANCAVASQNSSVDDSEEHYNELLKDSDKKKHSKESALAFFLETDMSKNSYKLLVKDTISRNCKIYPCYEILQSAMKDCLPSNVIYSEYEVRVPLQNILNKSVERLCEATCLEWSQESLSSLKFSTTLGCDSSSGHLNAQQKCLDPENDSFDSQHSLFISSLIIIQLRSEHGNETWTNPTPQSYRFCRTLRIAVEKENDESTSREFHRLTKEIDELKAHQFLLSNKKKVEVTFNVSKTLFDGKCINCIVGNRATQRCPMCFCTMNEFNNISSTFEINDEDSYRLNLGLGPLHCLIKCCEHLLHLGYKKSFKSWNINDKDTFETEKAKIKKKIHEALGIRVDQILQGKGTSNTGNNARICFQDPKKFAEALGIDKGLVTNIATVLALFRCGRDLDLEKLNELCQKTHSMFYELYSWCKISPTVHKLLMHGCQIAKSFPLPLIYYSEDASEAWHKLHRSNMTYHARQTSRLERLTDVFNRSLYLSDPIISLINIEERKKEEIDKKELTEDMQKYLRDVPQL